MPHVFSESYAFDDCFSIVGSEVRTDRSQLDKVHYLLRPFLLRRLKVEVEQKLPKKLETLIQCPLSEMQKFWTKL